ncbi:uncharacterized protein BDZ99DRAFT_474920 [Mytilinidion resinicola]|uniref:Uncharacterized protein n=1 Tax=Mytilinidion resinicola TaxID=574789 RepID=A0A6A6YS16_9PEZI|nr:uncharacterized protein BDZ99DRAFT_474920 [Mytilinidion resinicola]KAF2811348.1 hypothetical protein BDZ99DRAFT_474920 [Mytilinidion resinicola]
MGQIASVITAPEARRSPHLIVRNNTKILNNNVARSHSSWNSLQDHLSGLPKELRERILFFALPNAYALPISWNSNDTRQVTPTALAPFAQSVGRAVIKELRDSGVRRHRIPRLEHVQALENRFLATPMKPHRHVPIPLLHVSRLLRCDALDVLARQIPILARTAEVLAALTTLPPSNSPLRMVPKNFHLHILHDLNEWLEAKPFSELYTYHWDEDCKCRHSWFYFNEDWEQQLDEFLRAWTQQIFLLPANTEHVTLDFSGSWWRIVPERPIQVFVHRVSYKLWRTTKGKATVKVVGWVPVSVQQRVSGSIVRQPWK